MKKLYILLVLSFFTGWNLNAQNSWAGMVNFGGTQRYGAVGFSIGSKGYIGTGASGTGGGYKDFWEYDPSTNAWTQKADFGGAARFEAVGFSIGNKGYVGTGHVTNFPTVYQDFWEYNPSSNTWAAKANFIGGVRYNAVGFCIGNKGYIGTGISSPNFYQDFYEYNPTTDTWTSKANFPGGQRESAVGFSICDKGYIGTGKDNAGNFKQDFWEYNQSTNVWLTKANYGGGPAYTAVGFSICTLGYVGTGGNNSSSHSTDFYEYNPSSDVWTLKASFTGTGRNEAVGFSVLGKGYIGTGYDGMGGSLKDFLQYTPTNIYTPPQPGTITGSLTPCAGASQTYSVPSESCATYYTWTLPSGWTGTSTTNSITAIPSTVSGIISVTANNACGSSPAQTLSVNVNTVPAQPAAISGNTSICLGNQNVSITNVTAVTYTWTVSGGGTIAGSGNSAAVNWTSAGTHAITVIPSNTCGNGMAQTLSVTVHPLPNANAGNDASFCNGDSVTLSASGGISYLWSPASGLSCTNCQSPIAKPLFTTAYHVIVTDANLCVNSDSMMVAIVTVLVANAGFDSVICSGNNTTLHSSGGTEYAWQPVSALTNPSIANPIASPASTTTYTVTVSSGSCPPVTDMVTITVDTIPSIPTITRSGLILASSSLTGNKWYLNGIAITGAVNQFYTASQDGFYTVRVINSGCSATSVPLNILDVGIDENNNTDRINISPNPNNGIFILEYLVPSSNSRKQIEIYNSAGEKIYKSETCN